MDESLDLTPLEARLLHERDETLAEVKRLRAEVAELKRNRDYWRGLIEERRALSPWDGAAPLGHPDSYPRGAPTSR